MNILGKITSVWDYLVYKGGLILSFILTTFLALIGYPKQVIYFIMTLIVVDVITRWMSEVYKEYGAFSFSLFIKSWEDKILTSKKLKNGLFIKIFFYAIILLMAHQCSVVEEIYFGAAISNFLYSILIILDCISIIENMIDCGFSKFKLILKFFNRKKDELIEEE